MVALSADDDEQRLPLASLYARCDPRDLPFATTAEVEPIDATVGQDRAVQSLEFGLGIRADDYNLFVAGPPGTGRNATLRAIVHHIASRMPPPPDWCYVHNFEESHQPQVMSLPPGRGAAFARDVATFIEGCRKEVPRRFEDEAFIKQRESVARELQAEHDALFSALEEQARAKGFAISSTPMGIATAPRKEDGQPMSREDFAGLDEAKRKTLHTAGEEMQSQISHTMIQARRIEKAIQERLLDLDKQVALFAITPLLNELRQEYMDIPRAMEYLEQIQDDIVGHLAMFRPSEPEPGSIPGMHQSSEDFLTRYVVNVFVAHDPDDGAPVVVENNPTYYNLFGRTDYRSQLGAVSTDHTMIKAGAVHRANGGFLIVQAVDVLTSPIVWETLKRTIRCREIDIENLGEQFSAIPVATLDPQAIPLDVKIVLVGNPRLYQRLYQLDEDFRKLFRVKADFTSDMERTPACVALYAGFISSRVRNEKLRHFDTSAVARVVEYGSRLAEHQQRLSTEFMDISDLLTEADFWAASAATDVVSTEHVERAIEQKVYRSNLIEERIQRLIEDGTIFIETQLAVVGQVNGISVLDLGDYRFGRPSRITARVSLGRGNVVSIEREIQLSGKLHNKGFAIVNGYLRGTYEQDKPLSFAASIGFEQVYDEIDGDSASSAELYVLLSALAQLPIRQGIAVTGSVNQRGDIQPIGGVNEKIEGFFDVCRAKGLTGDQGVVIPRANAVHLMLRRDVVAAVEARKFQIWAIGHVDEGIEILTGVPAGSADARGRYPPGSVHRRVTETLARMSRRLAASGRPPRRKDNDKESAKAGEATDDYRD